LRWVPHRTAGFLLLGVIFAAGAVLGQPAVAAEEAVQVGFASFDSVFNGLFVAQEKGFFKKYGLDAKVVFLESDPRAAQALVAGAVDIIAGGGGSGLNAIANGADLAFVGSIVSKLTGSMVSRSELADPKLLKGGKWAISSFGAESELAAKKALAYYGLTAGKDVTLVPIGNQSLRFAALESGAVQATTLLPPVLNKAQGDARFKTWVALPEIVPEYLSAVWIVQRKKLQDKRDTIRRVLQAAAEGAHYYRTHREESIPVIQKWLKVEDPALAAAAFDYYAPLTSIDMHITEKSVAVLFENFPDAQKKGLKFSDVVDLSLVQALEKEGFFAKLKP
jgi:NitT/TauT family transport system substrate-binding protein